jgi:pSer/pThr/pTyr-binding forkhead associated (FHA) protein
VPSTLVSRKHCEIYRSGKEVAVRDLGSVNGTFVNGERVDEPTLLFEDDLLRIGPVTMRVFQEEAEAERPQKKPSAAKEESVVEDSRESTGASSILNYRETEDGSFVGIEQFDEEEHAPAKASEPGPEQQSAVKAMKEVAGDAGAKAAGKSALKALDEVVEKESDKVNGGDSALGDFLKGLG